jgi:hypothetical protein
MLVFCILVNEYVSLAFWIPVSVLFLHNLQEVSVVSYCVASINQKSERVEFLLASRRVHNDLALDTHEIATRA